ncbi:MAG: sulfate permease [Saprospiraceae bacterium]|nr:sulfate permease [Saprospiraceae bacterium]
MKLPLEFTPKIAILRSEGYTRNRFAQDLLSGLIVGVVALPLAIAFAIASGVSPDKGLVTAVVAGFLISLLGGSRVQIGGPTGAFIVIVYGIVGEYGLTGLITATLMAGFILIGMGLIRLGQLLKYFPYPLIVGFTSGIALIIFSSQINDALGMQLTAVPADFIGKWTLYAQHLDHLNGYAIGITLVTVLITYYFPKITKRIPGSLVAIILITAATVLFKFPVETIADRFGDIPQGLGKPQLPVLSWEVIRHLIQPAFAIALLGAIESLLSAVVADGMIGARHRSNMELVAQGIANIGSALFGGIPATGAIARTVTNIKNGGRTPIAGITHALVLFLIMMFLGPLAKQIPFACLAGVLIVIAYHMGEWHQFFSLLRSHRMDVVVLVSTFLLTVFFDLIIAIEIGMVLSSFLFMKRMSDSTRLAIVTETGGETLFDKELPPLPRGVLLYEIDGPLFFGAAQQFQDTLQNIADRPSTIVIRMRKVPYMDATGVYRLRQLIEHFQKNKVQVLLSGVNPSVREAMEQSGLFTVLPREQVFPNIHETLDHIRQHSEIS